MKSCLIFTGIYPPDIGGPATYVPKLEQFLRMKGWMVEVVCLADQRRFVTYDPKNRITRLSRRMSKILRVAALLMYVRKSAKKTDVIFANGMHEEAAILAVLLRKPLICKVVGNPIWEALGNQDRKPSNQTFENFASIPLNMRQKIRLMLWKTSLSRSQWITTPSQALRNHLKQLSIRTPIKVIDNGTEINLVNREKEEFDVVTVSRLVQWKNTDVLIEASKKFGFSLCIVGKGPQEDQLQDLAKGASQIFFTGALSNEETRKYVLKSKVFCLISSYEGLSFSLLEALASSRACVLSDIPGNRDAIRDFECAEFVPVRNVEATGIAITELLNDDNRRRRFQDQSRDLARKHYNIEDRLDEMQKLLSEAHV